MRAILLLLLLAGCATHEVNLPADIDRCASGAAIEGTKRPRAEDLLPAACETGPAGQTAPIDRCRFGSALSEIAWAKVT